MIEAEAAHVLVKKHSPIGWLTLNRPKKHNALSQGFVRQIGRAVTSFIDDKTIRTIILTSMGANFCSGLDLSEHGQRKTFAAQLQNSTVWREAFHALETSLPTICVMKGWVVGGGVELACSTHVRIAEEDTVFLLPEGQHGFFLGGGGSVRISRIIGFDRVREMMLTGRKVTAREALSWGLVHYVVPVGEGVRLAEELAAKTAAIPDISRYGILRALPHIRDASQADGLFLEEVVGAMGSMSAGFASGLDKFSKRKRTGGSRL